MKAKTETPAEVIAAAPVKNIYQTINAVMLKIKAIGKDRTNVQQKFKFRSIDQFMNELHPIFADEGLFVTNKVVSSQPQTKHATANGGNMFKSIQCIEFTFHALDGSTVSTSIETEAMDSGDKGPNKVIAIALKYALMQTFMIPTEDIADPDADTIPETKPVQPEAEKPAAPAAKPAEKPAAPAKAVTEPTEQQKVDSMLKKGAPAVSPAAKVAAAKAAAEAVTDQPYLAELAAAMNKEDLMTVWEKYASLQKDVVFSDAMVARKKEIFTQVKAA